MLVIAPLAVLGATALGCLLGLAAGYHRRWVDLVLTRACDIVLSFPVIILYMIILTHFGSSAWNIVGVLTLTKAPIIARIVRGLTLELREREYVAAAKMRGESALYIMLVEILPNARGPLLVDMCLRTGYNIIIIGVLGFLGIGLPPPDPDWGGMVKDTYGMMSVWPHMALVPCAAISSLVIGFNLLAVGLRELGLREPEPEGTPMTLLEFRDVGIAYATRGGEVPVIPALSFRIDAGEAMGLVGESGCGKSTVALAIVRYLGRAGRLVRGRILFEGRDLATLDDGELRAVRGRRIAMVYQDPMASLNPVMTVGRQLMEVPMIHDGAGAAAAHDRAIEMLREVKLADPAAVMTRYPHQLSGGQQQRIVIAMALIAEPGSCGGVVARPSSSSATTSGRSSASATGWG